MLYEMQIYILFITVSCIPSMGAQSTTQFSTVGSENPQLL